MSQIYNFTSEAVKGPSQPLWDGKVAERGVSSEGIGLTRRGSLMEWGKQGPSTYSLCTILDLTPLSRGAESR